MRRLSVLRGKVLTAAETVSAARPVHPLQLSACPRRASSRIEGRLSRSSAKQPVGSDRSAAHGYAEIGYGCISKQRRKSPCRTEAAATALEQLMLALDEAADVC